MNITHTIIYINRIVIFFQINKKYTNILFDLFIYKSIIVYIQGIGCDYMNELEFVFKKIIEIDNKSNELKSNTKKQIEAKEFELSKKIKNLDNERIQNSKIELEKKHNQSVKNSENTAKEMLKETDGLCKDIIKKYTSIKNDLKDKIVNDIIELN